MIRNNKGFMTVDYIFSLVLVGGFSFILFSVSLTLTVAEVVQYATYASARNFFAAHLDQNVQRDLAFAKLQELTSNDVVGPLLSSGWFEMTSPLIDINKDQARSAFSDYQQSLGPDANLFHGTSVFLVADVLDFNIPFYGSTVDDELRGGDQFGTYIGSYLGREVTQGECENFLVDRWRFIKQLEVTNGAASYSEVNTPDNEYMGIADNGC